MEEENQSLQKKADDTIQLTRNSILNLKEVGTWAKLLSIAGFIFIGFMIVMAFAIRSMMASIADTTPFPQNAFTFIYLLIALIYFFPILFLFNFSTQLKKSLLKHDSSHLDNAFRNLNSHYKYIGILAIIVVAFYGLGAIMLLLIGTSNVFPPNSMV